MDKVILAGLNAEVSALGFGCASLGSRVDARRGTALVQEAFERGITWFDLAPAYGAGQAEEIFASAMADRRDRLHICTKVGLLPPPQPVWKRALMPMARQVIGRVKPLRARIRRSGVTRNRVVPLTPDLLRSSLEQSLIRLKTDYIDVYALHNATTEALQDDDILRMLEDIRASGKVRTIAVASDQAAARQVMVSGGAFGVVQLALSDLSSDIVYKAETASMGLITHSVFGVNGALARAEARLTQTPDLWTRLKDAGLAGASEALLLQARLQNSHGVTLCSMMSPARLAANGQIFETSYDSAVGTLVQELFDPP